MNNNFYIREEFDKLRERINKELLRRSTYGWWNPLSKPTVGQDKSSPVALHDNGDNVIVNNKTYTINNPSSGSIEETRNINYPAHGDNPGGNPDTNGTSASQLNLDEIKNFLVGLANIRDINLFYGRDEIDYLGFRDPNNIEEVLVDAENDVLNEPVTLNTRKKLDPNNGQKDHLDINYPNYKDYTYKNEDQGLYVMESGEYDGEEMPSDGLSEDYFFDDYGAPVGNSNFHPTIKSTTELVRRDWYDQNNDREIVHKIKYEGGIDRSKYGQLPRNPNEGKEYRSRPAYIGKQSSCNTACSGMCSITCDNECSESCSSTCTDRCGNACTNACTNSCTSCTVHCYSSCKTKCENNVGYSCVNNGAQSFKVIKIGGSYGVPAENKVETKYYSCNGTCSYSCQFYPNKKTECWDSNCMGRCFTSCDISCSSSCFGGCVDNKPEDSKNYFTGKGRGCSSGCTINCVGNCTSSCSGYCVTECWSACKTQCRDNCFAPGTLIETERGPVPIEEVRIGELVLTNDNTYHRAIHSFRRSPDVKDLITIRVTGAPQIKTTREHPFWVRKYIKNGYNSITNKTENLYEEPRWVCAENINKKDKLCLYTPKCGDIKIDEGVAYIIGRWLGDGWVHEQYDKKSGNSRTTYMLCCSYDEDYELEEIFKRYNIEYCKYYAPTIVKFRISKGNTSLKYNESNQEIYEILENCGRYSYGKHLPKDVLLWDKLSIISLLKGYFDADGHNCHQTIKNDRARNSMIVSSVSKTLIYQISVLLRMIKMNPSWYMKSAEKQTNIIEGRLVNVRDLYTLQFSNSHASNVSTKYGINNDDLVWGTVHAVTPSIEKYDVYNLEIENNHTFYADGILVHNCSYACQTECGHGCANICTTSNSSRPRYCGNNCTDTCRNDCNTNCIGKGCRNICGTESHGACSFNCRINCMMASCTAQCKDACSAQCSSCVNLCDMNCGMCSSLCSTGCEADCNIICTSTCESDCSFNCTQSCTETCGACSSLCLSCVSRCINRCSIKCTEGCTSCSELCTFWCDSSCNSLCHENCSSYCIKTCEGSCIGYLTSETKSELKGADRPPTSTGYEYQHIENREQERDSFIIFGEVAPSKHKPTIYDKYKVIIEFDENGFNIVSELKVDYEAYWSTIHSGVYSIDETTGEYVVNENMLPGLVESAEGNFDNSDSMVIMKITANKEITKDDIWVITPFGFDWHVIDGNNYIYIIIKLDPFFLGNKYDKKSDI